MVQLGTDEAELAALLGHLDQRRAHHIGFPGAMDFDYSELTPFFSYMLNNIGDPHVDPAFHNHTKSMEREVVAFFADLFRAPANDRWGYVTNGGTEGNLYALYLARNLYPRGLVYFSESTHYSIHKALDLLGMEAVTVRATETGEMDYTDLRAAVSQHRDRPAIVVANIGTTITEAVDDVGTIKAVLQDLAVRAHYVHSDAALAGIPLALLDERPNFDLSQGADSITISGHKFIGSPFPCGVVVVKRSYKDRIGRPVAYTGTPDTTISGSRSGHAPLVLWYAIRKYGLNVWRQRAEAAREVAEYTVRKLTEAGWDAWRNPDAFTVMLKQPAPEIVRRWMLASSDGWSHVVCMPGVTRDQIDRFVTDLRLAHGLSAEPEPVPAPAPAPVPHGQRLVRPPARVAA